MILGMQHAQITVPVGREAEAHAYYCDLLDLPEIDKPDSLAGRGGFWLQVGVCQVHVGTEEGVDRLATKAHLAYEVGDLAKMQSLLEAQGIAILKGIPIPRYDRFEFRDPFGNRVEFIERRE